MNFAKFKSKFPVHLVYVVFHYIRFIRSKLIKCSV